MVGLIRDRPRNPEYVHWLKVVQKTVLCSRMPPFCAASWQGRSWVWQYSTLRSLSQSGQITDTPPRFVHTHALAGATYPGDSIR